jgi:hypothetical protein
MYGIPFKVTLKADFPENGIREIAAEAVIDHTRPRSGGIASGQSGACPGKQVEHQLRAHAGN